MSTKIKSKFNIKKAYIITFAIIAIVSTIALAGTPPTFQSISRTSILSGESRPENGRTISTSRWEKVHDFVNSWKKYSTALQLSWSLNVSESLFTNKNVRVWFDDSELHALYVYWDIQLSTAEILSNANNQNNCNTWNIWRIRLKMPSAAWSVCPLMICYPWTQSWAPSWVSRKSACDPVTIPTTNRNIVWIMTWDVAID